MKKVSTNRNSLKMKINYNFKEKERKIIVSSQLNLISNAKTIKKS